MADEQTPPLEPGDPDANQPFEQGAEDVTAFGDEDELIGESDSTGPFTSAPSTASAGVIQEMLGPAMAAVASFGARVDEVLQVGLESVAGNKAGAKVSRIEGSSFPAIEAEFSGMPHVGFELQLNFAEADSQPFAVLVPLQDLGRLLQLELDGSALQGEVFRLGQIDTISATTRELLDLMSLALFTDELAGAEATVGEVRIDGLSQTLAYLSSGARSTPIVLELTLTIADDGEPMRLIVVLPSTLLTRLAETLAPDVIVPSSAPRGAVEPTPLRKRGGAQSSAAFPPQQQPSRTSAFEAAVDDERAFGLTSDVPNVSSIRGGATHGRTGDGVEVHPVRFPAFGEPAAAGPSNRSLDLIMDVQMRVSVELGRSSMPVEDILALGPGSVVELNKLAGEPVDILVNDHLIARGEVVVVDENFGVRVTEIVSANRRAHMLVR